MFCSKNSILIKYCCSIVLVLLCSCAKQGINEPNNDSESTNISTEAEKGSYYFIKYIYEPQNQVTTASAKIKYTNESGEEVSASGGRFKVEFLAGPVNKGFDAKISFNIPQKNALATCYIYVSANGGPYVQKASTIRNVNAGNTAYTIK